MKVVEYIPLGNLSVTILKDREDVPLGSYENTALWKASWIQIDKEQWLGEAHQ